MNWLIGGREEICSLLEIKMIGFGMNVVRACSRADTRKASPSAHWDVSEANQIWGSVLYSRVSLPQELPVIELPLISSVTASLQKVGVFHCFSPSSPISPSKEPSQQRVKKWGFSLEEALKDPAGQELFLKFLESEFSSENLRWAKDVCVFCCCFFFLTFYEHFLFQGVKSERRSCCVLLSI